MDLAGKDDLTVRPGVSFGAAGALGGDADTAAAFNGTADGVAGSPTLAARPDTFSAEAWVRTARPGAAGSSATGTPRPGVSADSDRNVYMDNAGRIFFGVRPGGSTGVRTTVEHDDELQRRPVAPHRRDPRPRRHAALRGRHPGGQPHRHHDRVALRRLLADRRRHPEGLAQRSPASRYLAGLIDDVAIYPSALPLSRVQAHYAASESPSPGQCAPGGGLHLEVTGLAVAFNGTGSSDPDGTISGYAWDFGDATSGTRTNGVAHVRRCRQLRGDSRGNVANTGATGSVAAPWSRHGTAGGHGGRRGRLRTEHGRRLRHRGRRRRVDGVGGSTNFAVNNGSGAVTLGAAGAGRSASLNAVSTAAFDGRITVSADKIAGGGGLDVSLFGRRANNNDYRAKIKICQHGGGLAVPHQGLNNVETNIAGPLADRRAEGGGQRPPGHPAEAGRLGAHGSEREGLAGLRGRTGHLAAERQRLHGGPPDGGKFGPPGVPLRIRHQRSGGDARR